MNMQLGGQGRNGQKVRLKRGLSLFGKERGPFRFSIQAISASETGHFAF